MIEDEIQGAGDEGFGFAGTGTGDDQNRSSYSLYCFQLTGVWFLIIPVGSGDYVVQLNDYFILTCSLSTFSSS